MSAHTEFESSTPTDGAVVDEPVSEVVISFTNPATPVGDEFVAFDASGVVRSPTSVISPDGRDFELRFEPPLEGQVGIRWRVQAGDAHPIEGTFTFNAPDPAATTVGAGAPASPPASAAAATPGPAVDGADGSGAADDPTAEAPASLVEFLEPTDSTGGEPVERLGRVVTLAGVVLGLGGLAFLTSAVRGTQTEIDLAIRAVRVLGAVIALGAAVEYIGLGAVSDTALTELWSTSVGFAVALRVLGGTALAVGLATHAVAVRRRPRALSATVLEHAPPSELERSDQVFRWRPDGASWIAYCGVAALVASFWFDGHTVTEGLRPLHAVVNSVHLLAGSVWAGGVVAMSAVIWYRSRQGRPTRSHELIVRFSGTASIALVAVAAAGALMAVFVLDSIDELTTTEWGQTLLLKCAAVAVAAAFGAYNRFRLQPALDAAPDDAALLVRVRSAVTAEAILMVFVIVVTAWLVVAAT